MANKEGPEAIQADERDRPAQRSPRLGQTGQRRAPEATPKLEERECCRQPEEPNRESRRLGTETRERDGRRDNQDQHHTPRPSRKNPPNDRAGARTDTTSKVNQQAKCSIGEADWEGKGNASSKAKEGEPGPQPGGKDPPPVEPEAPSLTAGKNSPSHWGDRDSQAHKNPCQKPEPETRPLVQTET